MDGIPQIALSAFAPTKLPRGTTAHVQILVEGSLAGPATLPTLVARGAEAGPTLLAVAGVHGDEYEGMEAIRQVFAGLDPSRLRGTFVGVPVANPFAYEARARVAPAHVDGLNLARIFPGDPNGTPSRRLAAGLLALVERCVGPEDLFVDFHSGSADVAFAPLVGFRAVAGPAAAPSEEAARRFGLPRLWRIPDAAGPFNAETTRRAIPTVGTETTGRAGCDPADVALFAAGLTNLLAHQGMLVGQPPPPRFAGPARDTVDLLAPASGFFRVERRLLDPVATGDRLGTIVTPFGDETAEVRAPAAGELWALRSMPAVWVGELVAMVAVS